MYFLFFNPIYPHLLFSLSPYISWPIRCIFEKFREFSLKMLKNMITLIIITGNPNPIKTIRLYSSFFNVERKLGPNCPLNLIYHPI